jgi:hypothetical protein
MRGRNSWVQVKAQTGTTRDPQGRALPVYTVSPCIRAVVAQPDMIEQETAGDQRAYGQVDAVVRLPNGVITSAITGTTVNVQGGTPFDGDFDVVGLRPTRVDTRVMLRRRIP